MPTVTDSELKEIKDLIIEVKINQGRMDEKLESINENMTELRKQSNLVF